MMNINAGLLAMGLFAACGTSSSPQPSEPDPKPIQPETSEPSSAPLQTVVDLHNAWTRHDADALQGYYVPGALSASPGDAVASEPISIEASINQVKQLWEAAPKSTASAELILANGNRTAYLWRGSSGRGQSFAGATIADHAGDGRISASRGVQDDLTFYHQWGVRNDAAAPSAEPSWPTPIRVVATGSAKETENIKIATEFTNAWSNKDIASLAELFAPEYRHRPYPFKDSMDATQLAKVLTNNSHDKSEIEILDAWAAEDWFVLEATETLKPSVGPAAGKVATYYVIFFAEVRAGKILQTHGVFNRAQVMLGLGLIKKEELEAWSTALVKN